VFNVDPSFSSLTVRREQVMVVVHSINAVSVKVPGFPTSPAMGYFVAWDAGRGTAAAGIYLHYAELNRAAAYTCEPSAFPITALPQVTEEATAFLESMGFLVDDAAYGTLRPEEQVALLERIPIFHRDPATLSGPRPAPVAGAAPNAVPAARQAPASTESSARAQAVGRVLMSF
jgi:hypothetical protein